MADESVYEDVLNKSFNYTDVDYSKQLNSHDFEVRLKKLGNNVVDIGEGNYLGNNNNNRKSNQDLVVIDTSKPMNLAEIDFKLNQAKLKYKQNFGNLESKINSKQPIYYKPANSTVKFTRKELRDFLPPSIMDTKIFQKVPLLIPNKNISDNQEINQPIQPPTGEWINPIMKQALARQINKELELKKLIKTVFLIILIYLFQSIVNRLILILQAINLESKSWTKLDDFLKNVYYSSFITIINIYLILSIIFSLYLLFKNQDQCLDLPLNNQQRKLIGLSLNPEILQDDKMVNKSELILKQRQYDLKHGKIDYKLPKYSKFNNRLYDNLEDITKVNISTIRSKSPLDLTKTFNNESLKPLNYTNKENTIITTPLFNNNQNFELEKVKFNQDFNLKFDCKNEF